MSDRDFDVLVTGGGGFIGSALVRRLVASGRSVACLDVSGFDRLADLRGRPDVALVDADVRDAPLVDSWIARAGRVVHLAAVVGVDEYLRRPDEVLDVNVLGTRQVLLSALAHRRPVVMASTSEVYGKNEDVLVEDGDVVLGPPRRQRWAYAISKAAAEAYAFSLGRKGLEFAVVRYFNVYGPLLDRPGEGRVTSKFIGCLREGRPLPLVDGGEAVRSFCYIDDAIDATVALLDAVGKRKDVGGRVFNVGRAEPVSIRELARRVVELGGHAPGVVDVPSERFFGEGFEEVPHRVPDVSALRDVLGFEAKTSLDEGLTRTLSHWGLLAPTPRAVPEPMVPTIRPNLDGDTGLLREVRASLRSGRVTNGGPAALRFEAALTEHLGTDTAVVANGGVALELALSLVAPGPGKAVLPSFTYMATLSAVERCGLEPVFCDIDPETWTLDPAALAKLLSVTPDVRAVLPVNAYGVPPKLEEIAALARAAGAKVVYDDAHGFGTEDHGRRVSPHVDAETFSFHATKVLPAIEGGAVVARNAKVVSEVRRLRSYGLATDVLCSTPGVNAKLAEPNALLGLRSLAQLPSILRERRDHLTRLRESIGRTGAFGLQRIPDGVVVNGQNLAVRCGFARREGIDATVRRFAAHGVEARRYFHPPLHRLERFTSAPELLVTDAVSSELVCLPLHTEMTERVLRRVEAAVTKVALEAP